MINDFVSLVQSSVERSVELKLFKNKEDAAYSHLFSYKLEKIPLKDFKKDLIVNFKSDRLKGRSVDKSYPKSDRPKGEYNLEAVQYHRDLIAKNMNPLIWMAHKNGKYHLIHGSHKIVAAHLEKFIEIDAYVVYI
jgi:hypothetical protein